MIKNILANNEILTPNHREIEILRRHFPQCFTNEGAFDIDLFKAQIEEKLDITHEGYDLNFLGKNYAKLLSSMDTTTVIVPDEEHNALPENAESQNIYISGDNLDGLKHLLKSYAGAIKCIYIDPPYNTGTDGFVYKDRFTFTAEELSIKLSISETQAEKILDLTRRGSASHSAWLTFMACRLQLARDLLTDDGAIFISIDDNEQANLKLLCDSIFGEENFVGTITWLKKRKGSFLSKQLVSLTEYVLAYSRDKSNDNSYLFGGVPDETESQPIIKRTNRISTLKIRPKLITTKLKDGTYKKGVYGAGVNPVELLNDVVFEEGKNINEFEIKAPFTWSQEFFDEEIKKGAKPVINTNNFQIRVFRVNDEKSYKGFGSLIDGVKIKGTNEDAYEELELLLEKKKIFDYSKPKNLIKELIVACTAFDKDSIILDFFSGSATTAQAVMQLNAEDGGSRRYIMVQLPEETPPKSEARKAGYETIDQIGMERIRRAAAKIKNETSADIDYGFKHYTLAEPDDNTLDKMEVFDPKAIFADETLLDTFGKPTVLETWLVRDGYGFGADVQALKLNNYTVYHIGKHLYFIDTDFDEKDMVALIDHYSEHASFCPDHWVLFGYSFTFTQTEMLRKNMVILRDGDKNLNVNIDVRY